MQATADGRLVVVHDATLDRTTDATGAPFETDWATIAGVDAGTWFSSDFTGERVPTLGVIHAVLGVIHAVQDAQAWGRVEFTGWNLPLLALLKRGTPSARIGLFASRQPSWMPDSVFEHQVVGTAATSGTDVAHVYAGNLTPSISQRLRRLGIEVHDNDAASAEDVGKAVRADADRVSSNDVDLALRVLHHPH